MSVTLHFKDNSTPVVIANAVSAKPYEFTNSQRVDDQFIAVINASSDPIVLVPVVNLEYAEIA